MKHFSRAYARAEYHVLLQPPLILQIGRYDAGAECRLQDHGLRRGWALLTPCNPRSRRAGGLLNRRHLRELRQALAALQLQHLPALNRDPARRWPDEPGFLLVDAKLEQTLGLAHQFRQNAVVVGVLGQPPRLLWL